MQKMTLNQKKFVREFLTLMPLSYVLIMAGGIEMGISFRTIALELGLPNAALHLVFAIALPVGLVINGFMAFRVHALLK